MFIAAGAGGCSELLLLLLGVGGRPGADGNSVCSLLFGEARVGEEGFGDEGGNRKHNNNGRCMQFNSLCIVWPVGVYRVQSLLSHEEIGSRVSK
jgi:hypothetical protein